ncbi:MAG: IPT/TIG domain-containing protein, partial [Candidatus Buchananbacteria bacterium]
MNKELKNKIKLILPILILIIGSFFVASSVLALDVGLQYGNTLGLGTQDLRVTIMNVVRILLGFLGIVALLIALYGGFLWLSSAGNEEKIALGKKVLTGAVIGLVIIFLAFSIVSFIVNMLGQATNTTEISESCNANECVACQKKCNSSGDAVVYVPGECDSAAYCSLPETPACPKPATAVPTICRVEAVRGTGPGGVPKGYVGDFVTIEGWYFGEYSAATSQVIFGSQTASIVSCNSAPVWSQQAGGYGLVRVIVPTLDLDKSYNVTVTNLNNQISVASPFIVSSGQPGPGLACLVPGFGNNGQPLEKAEGVRFGTTAGSLWFTEKQSAEFIKWNDTLIEHPDVPSPAVSGLVNVTDANGKASNSIWFTVTCNNSTDCGSACCKNNICLAANNCLPDVGQSCDLDTATVACEAGGKCLSGLVCENCVCRLPGLGESCDANVVQASCQAGQCANNLTCFADNVSCTCQARPIIQSINPNDGAWNNFVTIAGVNFGDTVGHVYFTAQDGTQTVEASLASAINSNCQNTWSNEQIIVAIPVSSVDGPIKVVSANSLSDLSNDAQLPVIANFDINTTARPGLCGVLNTATNLPSGHLDEPIRVEGNNFFVGKTYFATVIALGTPKVVNNQTITDLRVPNLTSAATVGVRVKETMDGKEQYSNPYNFAVGQVLSQPIIYSFSPASGAVGSFVTIIGANFGEQKINSSQVKFVADDGSEVEADYSLPQGCLEGFWQNSQIVIKVPTLSNNTNYKIKVINQAGSSDTSNLTSPKFLVDQALTRPNICEVVPNNGPIAQPITVYGENLNSSGATVNKLLFTPNVEQTDLNVEAKSLTSTVPSGAMSGILQAKNVNNIESNGLNFTVGACTASSCQSGQECCSVGQYKDSCMPSGACTGGANKAAYVWTFTTGASFGPCSKDAGLCQADNTRCSAGYTCNEKTCNCDPVPYNCSATPYPQCTPDDT